jgi:hypothetical protein
VEASVKVLVIKPRRHVNIITIREEQGIDGRPFCFGVDMMCQVILQPLVLCDAGDCLGGPSALLKAHAGMLCS